MNKPSKIAERGNVIFYILIAIALLSALIFAVSQSGRGSVQQVNVEKAKLLANEILEYSNNVATAFAQLRLRGCGLEEMSFENSVIAGYTNAGAPADKSCNLFDLAGGGIAFKRPPPEAVDGGTGLQIFTIEAEFEGVSTTCGDGNCTEMIMVSGPLIEQVCIQLNASLGVGPEGAAPPSDVAEFATGLAKYTGSLGQQLIVGTAPTAAALEGRLAACMQDTDDNQFYYYKILVGR